MHESLDCLFYFYFIYFFFEVLSFLQINFCCMKIKMSDMLVYSRNV